ncbi:MAG: HAD hydrolase family protein, partial [Myxococcota bacterium]
VLPSDAFLLGELLQQRQLVIDSMVTLEVELAAPCGDDDVRLLGDDKLTLLKELAEQESVAREHIAFVGNDVNDVECIAWAGCGIAVANSRPEALAVADWVTRASGGRGAVREICEAIIAERT